MYDGVPQKIFSFLLGSRHMTENPKSTSFMSPSLVNKMFSSCAVEGCQLSNDTDAESWTLPSSLQTHSGMTQQAL